MTETAQVFRSCLLSLVFIYGAVSGLPANAFDTEAAQDLLDAALATDGGPGIQVAVRIGPEFVWNAVAGKADDEQDVGLTGETRLRIGSVSKLFTAALAARLIQAGHLEPDADVRTFVPTFPDKGQTITVRQLASHTAGIRHYDFSNVAEANNTTHYPSLTDALVLFADDPLLAPPGTAFNYSSFGYNLLGIAAGSAADSSYAAALARWVTGPLALENTLPDDALAVVPRRGRFYTRWSGHLVNTPWRDSSDYYPSGGLLSTADDLAAFAHAVFRGGFLEPAVLELMQTPAALADGTSAPYGFGWEIVEDGGTVYFRHGGETNGGYAHVAFWPARDLIVAGVANYNVFPTETEPAFFRLVTEQLPALTDDN